MSIRQGNICKLQMGEMAVLNLNKPLLVSTRNGAKVVGDKKKSSSDASDRVFVDTFDIVKTFKVKDIDMGAHQIDIVKFQKEFENFEVEEVLKRMTNAEDVFFVESPRVASLRKFFDGLGKRAAVLPSGRVADLGKNFTLWVRTDLNVVSARSSQDLSTIYTFWETIGFSCEIA